MQILGDIHKCSIWTEIVSHAYLDLGIAGEEQTKPTSAPLSAACKGNTLQCEIVICLAYGTFPQTWLRYLLSLFA